MAIIKGMGHFPVPFVLETCKKIAPTVEVYWDPTYDCFSALSHTGMPHRFTREHVNGNIQEFLEFVSLLA